MVFSGDLIIIEKKVICGGFSHRCFPTPAREYITVSENHVFPPQMVILIGENCDSPADWGTKMPWELSFNSSSTFLDGTVSCAGMNQNQIFGRFDPNFGLLKFAR